MRKISYWAKYHPQAARIIIAFTEITLVILSLTLGVLLLRSHILLHQRVAEISFALMVLTLIFYPYKGNPSRQYTFRKFLEFTLAFSVFTLGCFMANRDKIVTWNIYTPLQGHYIVTDSTQNKLLPQKKMLTKKEARKELRAFLKKEAKGKNLNWLYIILIVLGSIALLSLLAALACSIGCAGDLTGAYLVGIVGGAAIIFFAVWGIIKLTKSKNKKGNNAVARIKKNKIKTVSSI